MLRHLILSVFLLFPVNAGLMDIIMNLPVADNITCIEEHQKLAECAYPHAPFYDYIKQQTYDPRGENVLYNIGVMRKVLQIGKNVSDCLGHDLKCDLPRFLDFSLDTSIYAAEKVYGDAFHCFLNTSAVEIAESCSNKLLYSGKEKLETLWEDPTTFEFSKNKMFECVATELYGNPACSIGRIVSLYHAGSAGFDWMLQASRFNPGFSQSGVYTGSPLDLKFNADKYCDN
ncbi:hypothetical protein CRE_14388 [Caenorhabditis remanei]|uniref:DUF19 domain-containing protein n=1 Tax=Caenorhabditis remanei TaxID=31234 RepID=E3NNM4_CAERE|nr:hypothetical protein CRE_14388 [Caenorhabditis remanei]